MSDDMLSERYELGEVIGRGGLGVVRRARDVVLDRDVAIKAMREDLAHDEDLVRRLDDEARSAASLTHPNAVVLFDVLRVDDRTHLVMELVDGAPLPACTRDGRLPVDLAALVARDVASALAAAHARGIVHRDVKPSNVLVTREGHVKLSDFGIATAIGAAGTRITTVGTVIGSAAYLAPEQLLDDPVDGRADVYALGLVLGEIVTGQLGFGDGTWNEVMTRRLARPPASMAERDAGVPAELDRLVVAMTSREPDDRPEADEVVARLGSLVPRDARERLAALVPPPASAVDTAAATQVMPQAAATTRVVDERRTTDELVGLGPSRSDRSPTGPAATPTEAVASDETISMDQVATTAPTDVDEGSPPAAPSEPPVVGARGERVSAVGRDGEPVLRAVIIGAVLLVLVVLVVAFALGGGGDDDGGAAAPDGGSEPIQVVGGADLDPLGDGREHPEDIPALFDGDPSTQWETERYNQPDLGGTKPGVGFVLDLGESRAVDTIELVVADDGVDFEVWASAEDPRGRPAPDVGERVGVVEGGPAGTITVDAGGTEARWWSVWITRVGAGRGTFGEVTFR